MVTTVELGELVELFGAVPETPAGDSLDYWPYVSARFRYRAGDCDFEIDVSPGYERAHVLMSVDDVLMVDISLTNVAGMTVERMHGMEALRLHFKDTADILHIRLRPSLLVVWPTGGGSIS